jgi:ribosomal protein S21
MAVEVRRKPKESVSSMLRRFSRKVQMSGILLSAKKSRFQTRSRSKSLRKKDALYREKVRKERERMEKMGLLK